MVRTCALVERKYDKTKAVVIFDRCENGFPLSIMMFEFARENYPYKYPSPFGDIKNISCDTARNEKEMKEKGWVKLTDETQIL